MKHRAEIDGLRAFAVLPVILFHAGIPGFATGYLGVDLFFVISGFLISGLIQGEIDAGAFTIFRFYERRARRILPCLLLVLFACVPLAWAWMTLGALRSFGGSMAAAAAFTANFYFANSTSYFEAIGQQKPLLHTWSLGVEEQFYLLFPWLMLGLKRVPLRWRLGALAALGAASLGHAALSLHANDARAFYWTQDRAWELLIGALAALLPRREGAGGAAALAGALLIAAGYAGGDALARFPSVGALLVAGGTAALLRYAREGTLVARALTWRPFVAVGLVSYGAYLWHEPLFAFARLRFTGDLSFAFSAALVAATFGLAAASYFLVEQPVRDRRRTATRPTLIALAALSVAAIATGLALQFAASGPASRALPLRSPRLAEIEQRLAPNFGFGEACDQGGAFVALPQCANGANPEALVWGDSYAMHLIDAFVAANPAVAFAQATRSSCAPLPGYAPLERKTTLEKARSCIAFNDAVLKFILADPGIKTVVLSSAFEGVFDPGAHGFDGALEVAGGADAVIASLLRVKSALELAGKRVVLVSPPALTGANIGDCLAQATQFDASPAACDFPRAAYERRQAEIIAMLKDLASQGLDVVWLPEATCHGETCAASADSAWLYRDAGHLSVEGSQWLGAHDEALRVR